MPFIITVTAILYAFGLWCWLKRIKSTISVRSTKVLLWTHALLLILFCISAFLSIRYAISFRGMWVFRIIAILFLFTGIVTYVIGHKSQFNVLTRIYFLSFSALPTIIGLFLLIPFLGIVVVLSLFGQLTGTGDTSLYDDKNIRIQTTFLGVLGPSHLDIYKKKGFFEKRVYRSENGWSNKIDSVKTFENNDTLTISIYHDKSEDPVSPLTLKINE